MRDIFVFVGIIALFGICGLVTWKYAMTGDHETADILKYAFGRFALACILSGAWARLLGWPTPDDRSKSGNE